MTPQTVNHNFCCNSAWCFSICHIPNHYVRIKSQWRCTLAPRVQSMGLMELMCLCENPLWFYICRQHYCTYKYPNICACNLLDIMGCDFGYSAPLISTNCYQLIIHWLNTSSLFLLNESHLDGKNAIWGSLGKQTEIFYYHSSWCRKIHRVIEKPKRDREYHCWAILFGWSPRATEVLNNTL